MTAKVPKAAKKNEEEEQKILGKRNHLNLE
jgi:hypothetical protein